MSHQQTPKLPDDMLKLLIICYTPKFSKQQHKQETKSVQCKMSANYKFINW